MACSRNFQQRQKLTSYDLRRSQWVGIDLSEKMGGILERPHRKQSNAFSRLSIVRFELDRGVIFPHRHHTTGVKAAGRAGGLFVRYRLGRRKNPQICAYFPSV